MTDVELVAKKLAFIETCVRDVVEHRLDDLLAFVSAIRGRLAP